MAPSGSSRHDVMALPSVCLCVAAGCFRAGAPVVFGDALGRLMTWNICSSSSSSSSSKSLAVLMPCPSQMKGSSSSSSSSRRHRVCCLAAAPAADLGQQQQEQVIMSTQSSSSSSSSSRSHTLHSSLCRPAHPTIAVFHDAAAFHDLMLMLPGVDVHH